MSPVELRPVRLVALALFFSGCAPSLRVPEVTLAHRAMPASRQFGREPARRSSVGAALADLVPYSTDGRSLAAIRTLWTIGHEDPTADEARYLAAAASLDFAAVAALEGDGDTLAALARIRALPDPENTAALYTTVAAELRTVRDGVHAAAARGLVEGVELLQLGADTPRGRALMLDMLRRGAPAAHIAGLFHVEAVRRAVASLGHGGLAALGALAPAATEPPIASAPAETLRAATAVQAAVRRADAALRVDDEDPFAPLARPIYQEARAALARVVLEEPVGAAGAPASRVLVEVGMDAVRLRVLPLVAIVDGHIDPEAASPGAAAERVVRYAPRWGAKVTPHEPFVRAAREVRAEAERLAGRSDAPPVSVTVDEELEAHVLARAILSLMAAGLDDVRLRRSVGGTVSEVRLRPVAGNRVDERQTRGRARVDVCGPFDYEGAERTFQRHATAGRPASAQLVLFALIASRALYRALDAVHVAWPEATPDVLLVLPQQVP